MTAPTDVLTTLTSLAVSIFRERATARLVGPRHELSFAADPVLQEAEIIALFSLYKHTGIPEAVERLFSEPDLAGLAHRKDTLGPMLMYAGGGTRVTATTLVTGLFSAAFLQIFFLRLPADEKTFVRTVLAGFEELRRAARGERVRVNVITGIAGVRLPEGAQISTPWGIVRPAQEVPKEQIVMRSFHPKTTCILSETRLLTIKFDFAPNPQMPIFNHSELTPESTRVLFPLACALASHETMDPSVPIVTWWMLLFPFQSVFSYLHPLLPPQAKPHVDIGDRIGEFEEWARIVDSSHSPAVDIAARRLASAAAHRLDPNDSLIDAVMVWENLLGASSEVTFRVTAALAKALEPDRAKRRTLRKELAHIYDIRSRVVHGVAIDRQKVSEAAKKAIDVAVRALRVFYRRGPEWLAMRSSERADSLLLEEP